MKSVVKIWKLGVVFSLAALVFAGVGTQAGESAVRGTAGVEEVSAERILEHIKHLASDELEGRGTGEPGGEKAARYIAKCFDDAGLKPAGDDGSFLQGFSVVVEASLGEDNGLAIVRGDIRQAYRIEEDFRPLSFSESAEVSGEVVFAGYGITAKEFDYDDYEGIDAQDKIVIVMRHEPAEKDEESPFDGASLTHYSDLRYKAMNAREHGAAALVLCTDPLNHPDSSESLLEFDARQGRSSVGIPCVQLSTAEAEDVMRSAGLSLGELQAKIDRNLMPQSAPLTDVRMAVTTEISRDSRRTYNVLGLLKGSDPALSGELVVLGAHFDHLGRKGEEIYYGADDNASGTAALLELARVTGSLERPPARSILFAAFSGEEIGLLGSMHLARELEEERKDGGSGGPGAAGRSGEDEPSPSEPGSSNDAESRPAEAMINLDMVGRLRDDKVYVGGVESSPFFRSSLDELAEDHGLDLLYSEPAYGASDHTSFYARGVPVLMFFTGAHTDHHKTSDTWEKINAEGEARVVSFVGDLLLRVASHRGAIAFTRETVEAASPHRGEGYGGRGRASLGIVPDFSVGGADGVKLAGVREGSAADDAGLEAGDVMVSFDGRTVKDLGDLSYLLKEKKPGDAVVIVVIRDGEEVTAQAVLRAR